MIKTLNDTAIADIIEGFMGALEHPVTINGEDKYPTANMSTEEKYVLAARMAMTISSKIKETLAWAIVASNEDIQEEYQQILEQTIELSKGLDKYD